MQTALGISESECLRIVVREFQLLKSDDDDPIFHAVEVTQFKIPASELSVPSDSVQEFVNGNHNWAAHCAYVLCSIRISGSVPPLPCRLPWPDPVALAPTVALAPLPWFRCLAVALPPPRCLAPLFGFLAVGDELIEGL